MTHLSRLQLLERATTQSGRFFSPASSLLRTLSPATGLRIRHTVPYDRPEPYGRQPYDRPEQMPMTDLSRAVGRAYDRPEPYGGRLYDRPEQALHAGRPDPMTDLSRCL